jgi:hypothetical protein
MAVYSFLDLACDVLKVAPSPLTYQEVWQIGKEKGLAERIKTTGKTPWQSLGAQLYVEVRDNEDSRFIKVGKRPARFFLKERAGELLQDAVAKLEKEEAKKEGEEDRLLRTRPSSPFDVLCLCQSDLQPWSIHLHQNDPPRKITAVRLQ